MIIALKALRDALVADVILIGMVPAANIYAGLRDEKTPIPAVDVFTIPGAAPEKYAGAKVGGMTKVSEAFQISVFHRTESGALKISDQIMAIMLGDNTTLNTAKIKNVSLMNMPPSLREANISHVPLRFRCNYHITIS